MAIWLALRWRVDAKGHHASSKKQLSRHATFRVAMYWLASKEKDRFRHSTYCYWKHGTIATNKKVWFMRRLHRATEWELAIHEVMEKNISRSVCFPLISFFECHWFWSIGRWTESLGLTQKAHAMSMVLQGFGSSCESRDECCQLNFPRDEVDTKKGNCRSSKRYRNSFWPLLSAKDVKDSIHVLHDCAVCPDPGV
jgi:hypothetical protein